MGNLLPVAHPEIRTAGTHFWNLMLSDQQLVERLRHEWPDFSYARETQAGAGDCWVVRFTAKGKPEALAIQIAAGASWIAYRYALYCCYVYLLSGGGS